MVIKTMRRDRSAEVQMGGDRRRTMFFDVEGTGVEAPLIRHDSSQEFSHRERQQLRDNGGNDNVGVPEEEELQQCDISIYRTEAGSSTYLVDSGHDDSPEHSEEPYTPGVDLHSRVVHIGHGCPDFWVG